MNAFVSDCMIACMYVFYIFIFHSKLLHIVQKYLENSIETAAPKTIHNMNEKKTTYKFDLGRINVNV